VLDDLDRCQLDVVLPATEQRIDDGALSTGLRNYEEFFQGMVSLAGESQNFDGNGSYVRIQAGGPFAVQTPPLPEPTGPLHASASLQPLGTRPLKTPKPPYKPNVKCHTQPVPNLSDAAIGGGP
jgi:phospholipid/cholesterol/gamma-HCH transport system substrate-binding protein